MRHSDMLSEINWLVVSVGFDVCWGFYELGKDFCFGGEGQGLGGD